jgi:hypothetical protein
MLLNFSIQFKFLSENEIRKIEALKSLASIEILFDKIIFELYLQFFKIKKSVAISFIRNLVLIID